VTPESCWGATWGAMGCGGSKAGEAVETPKDVQAATKTGDLKVDDVKVDTKTNAAGRRVSKTVRRIAVRAETQDDMSEENFEPTTTQKTPEQTDRIMIGIDQNELLSGCARVVTRRLEWQRCACTHQRLW